MNNVVRFPVRRHARASSVLSASRANRSAVNPADLATSVSKTRRHQSDGILSRCHHLRTREEPPQSTSAAMASREGQSPMTSLNEQIDESAMSRLLGQYVPIGKGNMGRDIQFPVGHCGPMGKDWEKLTDSEWQQAFQERLRRIQGKRTHEDMADYFDMPLERWKKCVNRGDTFPMRKLPRLALLSGIPMDSLIKGDRDDELPAAVERYRKRTPSKPGSRRAG